jgi:SAM-dependent methyltransferase
MIEALGTGVARSGVHGSAGIDGSIARRWVLDLGCGDHPMPGAIGMDLSLAELTLSGDGLAPESRRVQARAQALPFRDASFDACVCHLAFMLFDDVERVVAELGRVLVPGGVFVALLGGGPVEPAMAVRDARDAPDAPDARDARAPCLPDARAPEARDAFHRFLAIGAPHFLPVRFGDPRAKSERGWRELFAGWSEPRFERVVFDLGGTFDDAWDFLGASYQLDPAKAELVRDQLRAELGDRVTCKVACWLATITRP